MLFLYGQRKEEIWKEIKTERTNKTEKKKYKKRK